MSKSLYAMTSAVEENAAAAEWPAMMVGEMTFPVAVDWSRAASAGSLETSET